MENMMVKFTDALVSQIVKNGIDRDCIRVQEVTKNNAQKHMAVCIKKSKETPIAHVMYTDGYLRDWESGKMTIDDIAKEFIKKSMDAYDQVNGGVEMSREVILDNAFLQIAGAEANAWMILDRGVPFKNVLDMVLFVRVRLTINGTLGSCIVTKEMLRNYDITESELFSAAKQNTIGKYICVPVEQLMASIAGQIDDYQIDENAKSELGDHGLYVATNKDKWYGASVLAFPELLQKYAERLGGSVYIMPSSIHEVMVIKKTPDMDPDDLRGMVKEINHSQVMPEEILTDNLYEYDIDKKELRVA